MEVRSIDHAADEVLGTRRRDGAGEAGVAGGAADSRNGPGADLDHYLWFVPIRVEESGLGTTDRGTRQSRVQVPKAACGCSAGS